MGKIYSQVGIYKVPINRTIYNLGAVVLGNRQVALRLDDAKLQPVYRSPPMDGVERLIDIGTLGVFESVEASAAADQYDGRVPVSLDNPNRTDAARVLQDFIRVITGNLLPLEQISRRYAEQTNRLYAG